MKKLKFKLALVIAILPALLAAQETIVTLNTDHSGTSHDIVARNTIFLKPGFSYTAVGLDSLWAHIDPDLSLPPITEVNCVDPSTFPIALDIDLPVGAIPGQAGVSPIGAANYTIPIEMPPGTQGMQPNLSVAYSSQAGNGIMGVGWNLTGLSAITRVPKNIYNDGIVEEIELDWLDNYAFNGQRLILIDGAHGTPNSEYRTEIETYMRVIAQGNSGKGPKWFKIETKDGLIIEFGNSSDSRVMSEDNNVIAWKINKITDQHSNYMVFEYRTDDDEQPISAIKYTGNTTDPYNTIRFNYVERNDVNTTWPAKKQITADLLLENIEITSENAFVRKYEFGYECNFYSQLVSVKLTGSEGVALNVISFKYGDSFNTPSNVGFDYYDTNLGSNNGGGDIIIGDFNGDGFSDIINFPYTTFNGVNYHVGYKQLTNAKNNNFTIGSYDNFNTNFKYKTSYGAIVPTTSSNFATSDFNGDGMDDFIVFEFNQEVTKMNKAIIYYSTETTFYLVDYQIDISCNSTSYDNKSFVTGDFDGDGTIDYLTFLNNGSIYKTKIHFPNNEQSMYVGALDGTKTSEIVDSDHLFVIDFNGDGKDDLMTVNGDGSTATTIYTFEIISGNMTAIELYSSGYPTKWHTIFPGDFNGDGKTDLLATGNDINWFIGFSNGNYFNEKPFAFVETVDPNDPIAHKIVLGDYNGDGKTDIVHAHNYHNGNVHVKEIDTYYCNGTNYLFKKDTDSPIFNYLSGNLFNGDFNGNGKSDLINMRNYDEDLLVELIYLNKSNQHFRLNTVYYGLNSVANFNYKPITDNLVYTKGSDATYPVIDIQVPINVVSSFASPNGIGGTSSISYAYEKAKLHKHGKGFLGFLETIAHDNTSNYTIKTSYKNETPVFNACIIAMQQSSSSFPGLFSTLFQPLLTQSVILDSNNDTISKVSYINEVEITDPCLYLDYELFYINPDSKIEKNFLQNLTTTTNYSFDEYGNPTYVSVSYNGDATTQTTNTYTGFGSWWCPKSRLQQSTVTNTRSGDNFTATTEFAYNNNGALTSKINFAGLAKEVTGAYTNFDNFGNPKTITVSAVGLDSRQTLLEYDDYGRFAEKHTNPLLHEIFFTYDGKTGQTVTQTDVNGLVTSYEYDGFGRLEKTTYPDLNTTEISRTWDINGIQRYYTTEITGGQPERRTYYDILGRNIKTGVAGFNGTMVYSDTEYTPKGELWKVSEPYIGSATHYTEYKYFDIGRLEKITYPSTATQTYSYNSGSTETTISSSNGTTKTTQTDGTGALISSLDNGGLITYTYYAHGGAKDISYGGNTISMLYDDYGRQTSLTDPDAGTINYTYNAYGELENQTDAKGNSYDMFYDVLGRLDRKELEGTTVANYTYYDASATNGIGLLASLTGEDNNISYIYEYDNLSQLKKKTEIIEGRSFVMEYAYDPDYSQLNKIIQPNGYTIDNVYQNGYLSGVQGTNVITEDIFMLPAYNERGQITSYTLGNGLTTTRDYNDFGMPTLISIPGIQNLQYDFNVQTGNLNSREDVLKGLQENFTYDQTMKNRLKTWKVNTATADTVLYTSNGNIDKKSGLGSYIYDQDNPGVRPHAVTEIENTENVVSMEQQDITYTPFNKVEIIEEGDYRLVFTYGPDNSRKKTDLYKLRNKKWNWQKTKYFVSGGYELEVEGVQQYERHLNYIYGGDGLAAIFEMDNNNPNLYYIHKDHLGSYQSITDNNGAKVDSLSFDPWGRQRSAVDWSFTSVSTDNLFDRGFTGHEYLDEFNLINMNGRVYDPLLGRFLSPDNYMQLPDYTQSLNRYTYALNNPLIYTDPDGEFWHLVIGATIGGVINWATHGAEFTLEGLGYFGVGAAAGALGAGVGAGISSAIAGGSFGAGFVGSSAAMTATSSFATGAAIGGGAGFSAGFTNEFGNGLMQGQNFGEAMWSGTKGGLIGAASGAVVGGLVGAIDAAADGRNFWHGGRKTTDVGMAMQQVNQAGQYDCNYACAESVDGYYGNNQNQGYFQTLEPGNGIGLQDTEIGRMYGKAGYSAREIPINQLNPTSTANDIANTLSTNKPVVLNYNTGVSGGVNAAGQRITFGHATVVTRVRIFNNGRFVINVMNPGSGTTRFANAKLFHLIFGVY